MAQKVDVILVDDIDGSEAAETVSFGLDGTRDEIDLNSGHAQELREQLDLYVRVTGPASRAGRGRRTGANNARNKEIRDWARQKGLDVNERGRVPAGIVAQFEAANGK